MPTEVFAQRKDVSTALEEIKKMPDVPQRAAALTGLLTHADITDPAGWLKTLDALYVDPAAAAPMFARLGATGKGREAFELAAALKSEPAAGGLAEAALDTWILTDFRGFFRFFKEKADPSGDFLKLKDIAIGVESAVHQLAVFGARDLLQEDDPIPPKYLFWNPALWTFFAFEERDLTFRYLERHATDPDYEGPISAFTDVAVRFDPERATALNTRAVTVRIARDRKLNADPDADSESSLETDRFTYGAVRHRLVQFWPEKALTLLAPATGQEWEALCREILDQHPVHLTPVIKKAPESARQSLANLLTTDSSGDFLLPPEKRRLLSEALKAAE